MKIALGMEMDLGPGHIVLDRDPVPQKTGAEPPPQFSVHVIVIVLLLEHCTVVIGMFKFKFQYSMHSVFRKSSNVLSLFQYKYLSEYLSCGRLQWERTEVESLNFACHVN